MKFCRNASSGRTFGLPSGFARRFGLSAHTERRLKSRRQAKSPALRWLLFFVIGGAIALHADLPELLQNVDSASRLQAIFFRNVALPSGLVPGPPAS